MAVLTKPHQIHAFRLITLRAGVRLEIAGMTRNGKSASAIAAEELGLPKGTSKATVLAALNRVISEAKGE